MSYIPTAPDLKTEIADTIRRHRKSLANSKYATHSGINREEAGRRLAGAAPAPTPAASPPPPCSSAPRGPVMSPFLFSADLAATDLGVHVRSTTTIADLFGDAFDRALWRETTYSVPDSERQTC